MNVNSLKKIITIKIIVTLSICFMGGYMLGKQWPVEKTYNVKFIELSDDNQKTKK